VTPVVLMPADVRFPLERANGIQIVKTADALARAGARTRLLVRQSDERSTPEILSFYGLEPHPRLSVERLSVGHRRGAFALPRALFLARAARESLLALRADQVVYTRDLQLADVLLSLAPEGRLVYEAHAVETLLYEERGALYGTSETPSRRKAARLLARERRVWRRAAGCVTTTAGIRDTFASLFGPRERVRVIPNGCDAAAGFTGLAREQPTRVLYAGQLYPWKGVDVLVRALAPLGDARLVILGGFKGDADHERIRALVDAQGLTERTEMPGTLARARVAEELEKAAVVVVPFLKSAMTERHTSPIKMFEAMAAGRPIVATDLPSTREILRHQENALLVPPSDVAALRSAIARLLGEPNLAERLARAAHAQAPAYSWDARAERLLRFFDELGR
jgi:glycosyltransferase involved in cell wall biosynthesis